MIKTYKFDDTTQITPHFNAKEFRCKCGKVHAFSISNELVNKLEKLYAALNCSKIIVTSGYRCPTHDKNVGGSGTGQQTLGQSDQLQRCIRHLAAFREGTCGRHQRQC